MVTGTSERDPWFEADPVEVVLRAKRVVAACMIVAGLVAFGVSTTRPPQYVAETRLLLEGPYDPGSDDGAARVVAEPGRHIRNQVQIVASAANLRAAAEVAGSDAPLASLQERISVRAAEDADTIVVSARAGSAAAATALADAVAAGYMTAVEREVSERSASAVAELESRQEVLRSRIDALERPAGDSADAVSRAELEGAIAELVSLQDRINQLTVAARLYGSGVAQLQSAEVPAGPVSPRPLRAGLFGAVLGGLVAVGVAVARDARSDRVLRAGDAAAVLQAPLLAEIPVHRAASDAGAEAPRWPSRSAAGVEAYQFLATTLTFALERHAGTTVLMTSARPGEGKTLTVAATSAALAVDGRDVAMMDVDTRARGLSAELRREDAPGLGDLLAGRATVADVLIEIRGYAGRLRAVTAGAAVSDPAAQYRTRTFRDSVRAVSTEVEMVLLDAPPMLGLADASAVASHVDALVIVVAEGTSVRDLRQLRSHLDFIGAPLLGYVFNKSTDSGPREAPAYYGTHRRTVDARDRRRRRSAARQRVPVGRG